MKRTPLSPANTVIVVAGAVMFVASFLSFYRISVPTIEYAGITVPARSASANAWSRELFVVYTLPAFLGLVMAAQVALDAFTDVTLSRRPLGLTWDQVHLVLAVQATVMMLAVLAQSRHSLSFGIGFWLMLASAVALLVGALLRKNGSGSRPRAV